MRHATLKPGRFTYHNPLVKLDPARTGDVFRDAGGDAPEQITFDVEAAHLALIPHLAVLWDEAQGVPRVDPAAPYGDADLGGSMARILGVRQRTRPACTTRCSRPCRSSCATPTSRRGITRSTRPLCPACGCRSRKTADCRSRRYPGTAQRSPGSMNTEAADPETAVGMDSGLAFGAPE
ncbi:hypothetical protein [Methylobacterium gregans]|uniref:hypothetical protein n=1 Tax=Methylobacterium gregans TaxID=374424 RepID=UPI0036067D12